jgi:hypothetical protein
VRNGRCSITTTLLGLAPAAAIQVALGGLLIW